MLAGRQSSESTLLTVGIPTALRSGFLGSCSAQSCWGENLHSSSSTAFSKCFQHSGLASSLTVEEGAKVGTVLPFMSGSSLQGHCGCSLSACCLPRWVILSPGRPRQEGGCEFEASFSYKQTKEQYILKTR